jgi:hypothetical protein
LHDAHISSILCCTPSDKEKALSVKQREQLKPTGLVLPANLAAAAFLAEPLVRLSTKADVLSERHYVELFLKAINTGRLSPSDWVSLSAGTASQVSGDLPFLTLPPEVVRHHREQLAEMERNPAHMSRQIGRKAAEALNGRIVALPILQVTAEGPVTTYRLYGTDEFAGLDFGHWLLLSKHAQDLCRCHLPRCGIFFLVEPVARGRSRREYCRPAHRKERFASEGSERAAASRAHVPLKEWRAIKASDPGITPTKWNAKHRKQK